MTNGQTRQSEFPTLPEILQRWSPRAMSGEAISKNDLFTLFEAARWAPSCFNEQPWRIAYAHAHSQAWPKFFGLLVEANQRWASKASALLIIVSQTTFTRNGRASRTHAFDTGAAWQNLALQGASMNLVVHAMAGIDYTAATDMLELSSDYEVQAMVAVGKPGKRQDLDESFRDKEFPSDRNPVKSFVFEGTTKNF